MLIWQELAEDKGLRDKWYGLVQPKTYWCKQGKRFTDGTNDTDVDATKDKVLTEGANDTDIDATKEKGFTDGTNDADIDATKLFLLASLPEVSIQMTIRKEKTIIFFHFGDKIDF